jgi:hypothetical protein
LLGDIATSNQAFHQWKLDLHGAHYYATVIHNNNPENKKQTSCATSLWTQELKSSSKDCPVKEITLASDQWNMYSHCAELFLFSKFRAVFGPKSNNDIMVQY